MKTEKKSSTAYSSKLQNLQYGRIYVVIFVLLLIAALLWVVMTVMSTKDTSVVTTEAIKYATPINPNLDIAVFATVEGKRSFTEAELESFPINFMIKDRAGVYVVVPLGTSKEKISEITTSDRSRITPTNQPSAPKDRTASDSSTIKQ